MSKIKMQETMDLAELERQLGAVIASRPAQVDDPLIELARMVGQAEQGAGRAADVRNSFDDFLAAPPRPAGGAMPSSTPPFEPLFPEAMPSRSARGDIPEDVGAEPEPSVSASVSPELVLTEPFYADHATSGALPALEGLSADRRAPSFGGVPKPMPADASLEMDDFEAELMRDFAPGAAVASSDAAARESGAARDEPPFADMMAEFESAMRDVGGRPVPPEMPRQASEPSHAGAGLAGGIAAAGAAAAIAASRVNPEPITALGSSPVVAPKPNKSRRGLMLAAGVVGVSLLGVVGMLSFGGNSKPAGGSVAPTVISARPGATKEKPANPGGADVPNQDREVLQKQAAAPSAPVRVVPREEQPLDLAQAQRQTAAPESPTIRQIPGVAIVAPVTTTPPAMALPSADAPAPRPVASVPITIAGQPPVAPSSPPVAAPVLSPSVAVPPVVPPAPVIAAPSAASSTPAQSAPAATSAAEPRRQASTEPRRVRSVPIRSEAEGQAANRTAAPRPVAPEAEPGDPNGPLRITPAANRAPRQQTAAAASPATAPTSGGSGFAVQLAAEGSDEAARAKFNRVRSQHTGVLGSLSPNIRSAEVNGRSVYRVRVGNLSREDAVGLCERLKADGGSCFVARN